MRKLLLLFTLALSLPSSGQQIAVPYREGAKWGVSNRDGKLIIAPKFDSITFGNKYINKPGGMISWSKGKQGLIIGGRELLEPEYSFIANTGEFIKAEKTAPESILTYLFDPEGTPIYPGGIIHIGLLLDENIYDKQGSYKVVLLQVTGANNLESIFVWSTREKAVVQWLARDVYSAVLADVKGQSYAMMRIREKENSPVKISHVWFGADGRLSLTGEKREIPIDKERDGDLPVVEAYGMEGDISIDAAPVGDIDMRMAAPEASGSYTGRSREESITIGGATATVKSVNIYRNYKKEPDGTLVIEERDGTGKTSKSKLKFRPDSFTVKNLAESRRIGDTMFYYNTYAMYSYKGRSGVLKEGHMDRGMEYDELSDAQYTSQKTGRRTLVFIAGSRDKRSKAMKYGLLDVEGKEIIPFVYDELKVANTSASPGYDLVAKKPNDKYVIITAEGNKIADEIDDIESKTQESKPYLEIKAGGKYGFFTRINGENRYLIPPVFPYPIKTIYMAYPGQNLWMSLPRKSDKQIVLVELMDADGNTKGYAGEDGFLYFKD